MNKFQKLVLKALIMILQAIILNVCHTEETRELLSEIQNEVYK